LKCHLQTAKIEVGAMRCCKLVVLTLLIGAANTVLPLLAKERAEPAERYGRVIVDAGLQADQVLQRNADGVADFDVTGRALAAEAVELSFRILRRAQVVSGFDWRAVPVSNGKWKLSVRGLPTGGPFTVEFRLLGSSGNELDRRRIDNILVGDLWVTAGQSNMDGCGEITGAETPSEMVHAFSLADQWTVAEEPMHYCYESAYPVYLTSFVSRTERAPIKHTPRGQWPAWPADDFYGTSLGLTFAKRVESETGVPIGLVIASLGGTTIDQWSPALKDRGGESLYGAMMLRIAKVGGKVRGVLWYQGESDSSGGGSAGYEEKLVAFVKALRADLHDDSLPLYCVQIGRQIPGRVADSPAEKNVVREAQRQAMSKLPHASLTTAIDLPLSSGGHLNADGYKRAGKRVANSALAGTYGHKSLKSGPTLSTAQFENQSRNLVRVSFDGVNGKLLGEPRVLGFSVRDAAGRELPLIESMVDSEQPSTILIRGEFQDDTNLWYGYGWDPVCNVVDEADMPVPALGPIPIEK
jgi:sialate O-acetylesterase